MESKERTPDEVLEALENKPAPYGQDENKYGHALGVLERLSIGRGLEPGQLKWGTSKEEIIDDSVYWLIRDVIEGRLPWEALDGLYDGNDYYDENPNFRRDGWRE